MVTRAGWTLIVVWCVLCTASGGCRSDVADVDVADEQTLSPEGITARLEVLSMDACSVMVQTTFHNGRDSAVRVDPDAPLSYDELGGPSFRVRRGRREVPYIGPLVSRRELRPEELYEFGAGETYVSAKINLAGCYDLSRKGTYTVRYAHHWWLPHEDGVETSCSLQSDWVEFVLDKGIKPTQERW